MNTLINILNGEDDLLGDRCESTSRERWTRLLTHIICIGLIFILPEILAATGRPFREVPQLRWGSYMKAAVYIAVFYVNYFVIMEHAYRRRAFIVRVVGWNLLAIAVAMVLFWLISLWMQPYWDEAWRLKQAAAKTVPVPAHHPHSWFHFFKFYFRDFVTLVLAIGLSVAVKLSDIWLRMRRRSELILDDRRREELANLRSQLNPHFLFNTLNSIYALIAVSPPQAQDAVHELSRMLRYVLYDNRNEVELEKEVDFVGNYVNLMALRLPPTTALNYTLSPADPSAKIAPMLFIPLIENAFKHVNNGVPDAAISILVTSDDDGKIICRTVNSFRTDDTSAQAQPLHGGIGIANLRRRLQLIYADRATLDVASRDGIFTATLTVPPLS